MNQAQAPSSAPILYWVRRDLRLDDHEGLSAAQATGRPVVVVFIRDDRVEALGAAPKWRLGLGVAQFARALAAIGSRLILRSGPALEQLREMVAQTGACAVWWSRAYDPDTIARDREIKSALTAQGVEARSFAGQILFEPWRVQTKTGGYYRVYTPFWKALRGREVPAPLPAVVNLPAPAGWPVSETISAWNMGRAMHRRGRDVVGQHLRVGEVAAQARLAQFMDGPVSDYHHRRDRMDVCGTSKLSENLAYGEISIRRCWHAGLWARAQSKAGAEVFLKELIWREFACHLAYHTPHILTRNWRSDWDDFAWNREITAQVVAWQRGRTGVQLVDAAMREMYITGTMHNRGRMIVASYLSKHLMSDWRIGQAWFAQSLVDWDVAANAMGWQWSAGCGPDAAPFFRIFNPDTQAQKFDPVGHYRRRFLAEPFDTPAAQARSYFEAVPMSWGLKADQPYPQPVVALDVGRKRALAAYSARK